MAGVIICPFCDNRIKTRDSLSFGNNDFGRVIKCRNCGEAFEPEPDEEDF
jgi:transcription elongation factor Elf1